MNLWYKLKDIYGSIRCWFRNSCNKRHFKYVWKAFKSYPFDIGYDFDTLQARFEELSYYYDHCNIAEGDEERARQLRLAASLLEIIGEKRDLFHFDGEWEEKELGDGTYELLPGSLKYHCDVHVNMKNIDRFIPKDRQRFYFMHPHELYAEKAWCLFTRLLHEKMRWWSN